MLTGDQRFIALNGDVIIAANECRVTGQASVYTERQQPNR